MIENLKLLGVLEKEFLVLMLLFLVLFFFDLILMNLLENEILVVLFMELCMFMYVIVV